MKLFIYSPLNESLRSYLRSALPASLQPVFRKELLGTALTEAFAEAEIIMGNPPVDWFAQIPPRLVFWQLDSAGFNQYQHLLLDAQVANMGDFYAKPCAETMVGGILAFYRGLPLLVKCQEQKRWLGGKIRPNLDLLSNKKVIILGAGSIGQAVKQMLMGFGCAVRMTARRNPQAQIYTFEALLEALPETDLVINTLPGGLDKYVSAAFFQAMKPGSLYASVGRGNTTDEQALIQALQSGKLAGAVLDVTAQEPLPETSPLWEMENVILTQHTSGGFKAEEEGKVRLFLRNLNKFLAGEPLENLINLSQGY
ncbi:2-hydroxyacid dehydrogenase [Adhaeribacter aerolatus]|uniref:2-hydroxyacid dehydrogenase n=1 Tax=Adhaeribacter aerolatus TaxID=670289 RepID=A0A512AXD3_9BACT|nr:D-2-hydroxyacid dehydrogenase [Adhaeribacter aerolatus]GEO04381.1 2-hydroxyacid dehydrogenase [Adhaeribacter aerolatus]